MDPSMIVIGAMKGGTSALYTMLAAHPRVLPPVRKELHFFNRDADHEQGLAHYRSMFPLRPLRFGRYVTFEASPSYLPQEKVALRIAEHFPKVLLVAILRDPVERAYSAWNMYHRALERPSGSMVPDPRTFEQAVEDELAGRPARLQHSYLAMGHYAQNLAPYMRLFPRENLLIFGYQQFAQQPAVVVNTILERWGMEAMDPADPIFATRANVKGYSAPMDAALRERLVAYFAPYETALNSLLGAGWDRVGTP